MWDEHLWQITVIMQWLFLDPPGLPLTFAVPYRADPKHS